MANQERTEAIIAHITKEGPKTQKQLAAELGIPYSSVSYYLARPLQRGWLVSEKVPDGNREVLRYKLPPKADFSKANPEDPFGLVAKRAAGVNIDRAYEVVKLRNSATLVDESANLRQKSVDEMAETHESEVQTTVLDNDPDFVEVVRERSPLVQRYPAARVEREETRPAPGFSCAYWSNGLLEMRRGEWIIATLTTAEAEHVREFLGRTAA